jgi:UDP-GlcNAc:undecaprenyl-phosphate GlcNAc-1-phosphate transferase
MILTFGIFILAFLLSLLLTPLVMQLAFQIGAIDKPNHRKIHTKTMPRMGGMAVFVSFAICMILLSADYKPFYVLVAQHTLSDPFFTWHLG